MADSSLAPAKPTHSGATIGKPAQVIKFIPVLYWEYRPLRKNIIGHNFGFHTNKNDKRGGVCAWLMTACKITWADVKYVKESQQLDQQRYLPNQPIFRTFLNQYYCHSHHAVGLMVL